MSSSLSHFLSPVLCLQHGRVILDIQLVPAKFFMFSIFIVAVIMSLLLPSSYPVPLLHRNLEALKVQALLSLSVWDLPMSLSYRLFCRLFSFRHYFPRLYYAIPFDVLAIPVEHVCSFYCSRHRCRILKSYSRTSCLQYSEAYLSYYTCLLCHTCLSVFGKVRVCLSKVYYTCSTSFATAVVFP